MSAVHWVELSASESDAALLSRTRRVVRDSADACCIAVRGDLTATPRDMAVYGEWIRLLVEIPVPLVVASTGAIGARGCASIIVADRVIASRDAALTGEWIATPGIATLLHRRFGPWLGARLVADPDTDLLVRLEAAGVLTRADDLDGVVASLAQRLGDGKRARERKRAMRAAAELPFAEALAFELWFETPSLETDR